MLFDHLMNPAFHFRYRWSASDVVIWDEHLTAQMGPFDFAPHHRRLARVTAGRRAPGGRAPRLTPSGTLAVKFGPDRGHHRGTRRRSCR